MSKKHLIAMVGFVNKEDNSYHLKVENLPNREIADAFAQAMGPATVEVLQHVMGGPPTAVGTNANVDEAARAAIAESTGAEMTSPAKTLEEFLEKTGMPAELVKQVSDAMANIGKEKDDCPCPGCVARRAEEAREGRIEAGSKSDAKH